MKQTSRRFIKFIRKNVVIPERVFLFFATTFGLLFVLLTPPFQAPDEYSHFLRAYQVSDLRFTSESFEENGKIRYGGDIPKSINVAIPNLVAGVAGNPSLKFNPNLYGEYVSQPLVKSNTEKTVIEAGGMYSPIVYAPQAIGISVGKIFEASPLMLMWLARLMNLALWITLVYIAIKIIPFGKWALMMFALNPVSVFLSASLSPDVINVGGVLIFISLLFATLTQDKISRRTMLVIIALLCVLALSKPVNLLFALLVFMIPKRLFGSWKHYLIYCVTALVVAGIFFLLWNIQAREVVDAAISSQSAGMNISSKEQLQYILSSPLSYVWDIFRNYILVSPGTSGDAVLATLFGMLGWLDTAIPFWVIILYCVGLFLAVLYQFGRGISLSVRQKAILIIVFMLGFIGNITAMYLNATPVASSTISGVQGRYFMPFIALLSGVFTGRKKLLQISTRSLAWILIVIITVVLLVTTAKIALRYYPL